MIAELEERLERHLLDAGASGYTVSPVAGRGQRGFRRHSLGDAGNVRIELLVPAEVASRVLAYIVHRYGSMGVAAFDYDADAVPGSHFVGDPRAGAAID